MKSDLIKFNGFIEHGDCCQLVYCDGVTDPHTVTFAKMINSKFHKAPDQKIKKELTTDKNTANFDIEKEETADVDIENEESSFSVAFNRFKFFKGCLLF